MMHKSIFGNSQDGGTAVILMTLRCWCDLIQLEGGLISCGYSL